MGGNCCWDHTNCVNGIPSDACNASCSGITELCTSNLPGTCICKPLNPCDNSKCENDSTCKENGDSYTCECKTGYYGTYCENKLCGGEECGANSSCVEDKCVCDNCYEPNTALTSSSEITITGLEISSNKIIINYSSDTPGSTCKPKTCDIECLDTQKCVCDKESNSFKCVSYAGNAFPEQGKVIWSYLCNTVHQNSSDPITYDYIKGQKINYLSIGFLTFENDKFSWNMIAGCKSNYSNMLSDLKKLHDDGICITASIGGEGSSTLMDNISTNYQSYYDSFIELRTSLNDILDGIDFDIEAETEDDYPKMGEFINGVAKIFKENKYVVTIAPTPMQLTPGCGGNLTGNGQTANNLRNVDMSLIDGIMLQWYEGGSSGGNSGQSPLTIDGIINFYIAFSKSNESKYIETVSSNGDKPLKLGVCKQSRLDDRKSTCSSVLDSCKTFPANKIAIGFQTYAPDCGPNDQWDSGNNTSSIITGAITKLKELNIPFLGIASWAIYNVKNCGSGKYENIFPDAYKLM